MAQEYEIGVTRSGLRMGFTTGSCAAAAAKAAAMMLLSGEEIRQVRLMTPKGIELYLEVEKIIRSKTFVECAIQKYSGDDPDITNGMYIHARVCLTDQTEIQGKHPARTEKSNEPEERKKKTSQEAVIKKDPKTGTSALPEDEKKQADILLDGGEGVGRVTKPGLEQAIGDAAINKVPRKMIREAVSEVCEKYNYTGKIKIVISIPEGAEIAKKTFNPRLGIEGGLSILGTSGIVEPMSEKALTDTIYLEMKMLKENGRDYCYVVPGNYGTDFLRDNLQMDPAFSVKCSNYVGETIEDAKLLGMKGILLIGHIGKFIKLAAGVMNTHSRQADCRMEVLGVHAAMMGAGQETVCRIMKCINTTEALELLREQDLLEAVMKSVMERMEFYLKNRAGDELEIGAIMFSTEDGILGKTKDAEHLLLLLKP